jgi:hypothetical protein
MFTSGGQEDYDPYSRLTEEKIDGAVADYTDLSALYDSGFRIGAQRIRSGSSSLMRTTAILPQRTSPCLSPTPRTEPDGSRLPGNLRIADAYVPGAVTIGGISYGNRPETVSRLGFDADFAENC